MITCQQGEQNNRNTKVWEDGRSESTWLTLIVLEFLLTLKGELKHLQKVPSFHDLVEGKEAGGLVSSVSSRVAMAHSLRVV